MTKHIKNKHSPTTQSADTSTRLTPGSVQGCSTFTLTTINTNTFRGDGQRISKVEGSQTINYIYRSGAVLYTTDHNHNPINLHLKDPAGTLIGFAHFRDGGSPTSNVTQDIRQSTSTVLDSNFDFLTGFRYTDFGITTRLTETEELIEIAYTGGIWDESTGLYYLNARFYNPVDARFMQIDVARNGGDLRATLSLYGYTEGDPINKIDPSGYSSRGVWVNVTTTRRFTRDEVQNRNIQRIALRATISAVVGGTIGVAFANPGVGFAAAFVARQVSSRLIDRHIPRLTYGQSTRIQMFTRARVVTFAARRTIYAFPMRRQILSGNREVWTGSIGSRRVVVNHQTHQQARNREALHMRWFRLRR